MPPDEAADRFVAALLASMSLLAQHVPGGWTERRGDAFGLFTGLAIPNLNGVLCVSPQVAAVDIAALIEPVRAAGVPYSLQLRPGSAVDLFEEATALGMSLAGELPAMVLEDFATLPDALSAPVTVRLLHPEERGLHLAVAVEGYEAPLEMLAPLVEALDPPVRLYVGEVEGEPAVTGAAIPVGDAVGIFNVATPPRHRRRGYAAALTARAVLDGLADGATWAFLQSSAMGRRMYESLGFRTVERWELWVGGQSHP
jgi:ribosomal protein S18 acetylase RimI-like enzyme